ncbi:helix-turn-helix transcriptional regulator [Bacillus subtilis]|uniref:helix-turn-helix transcriptional regulator n=1 Tax=Bacillus subtilis TaxID=1423 RepID=UPI0021DB5CED|nr:helix-turn-helix transcriptional regulator [Bacillus subtilis]
MSEYKNRGFLLKQRAFLKLYVYKIIDHSKGYGSQYLNDLQKEFSVFGYKPTHTELYKVLHQLTRDGYVKREKQIKGQKGVDFQEIVLYQLTDEGKKEYDLYKVQMKKELERCRGLLDKALKDHFGPVS